MVDFGFVVDDVGTGAVRQAFVHVVVRAHLLHDGKVLLDDFAVLAEGGNAVPDLVDDVGEHDDA